MKFACSHCDRIAFDKEIIIEHISQNHTCDIVDAKPLDLICYVCNKEFSNKNDMKKHKCDENYEIVKRIRILETQVKQIFESTKKSTHYSIQ